MLRSFSHPVACRCMLLRVIRSCCAKFETGQTFRYAQTDATAPNIVGLFLGFFPSSTGKQAKGRVEWGGGGGITRYYPKFASQKRGGRQKREREKEGGACYKSRCFCILPTNILTNPDPDNVSCQYVTNHKKGELLNLHHSCFFLIHENKLLIAAQPITVSASQTEFTTLEAL